MIDFLSTVLGALFLPKGRERIVSDRVPPLPRNAVERMPKMVERYRRWGEASGMTAESDGYRAIVAGTSVRIRTGLQGSLPTSVVVEIEGAHDAPTVLVTERAAEGAHPTVHRVSQALFDDPTWRWPIRSIAFAPGVIRLRFPPLTEPEVVAGVLEHVVVKTPSEEPSTAPYR